MSLFLVAAMVMAAQPGTPVPVKIVGSPGNWQIQRAGKPYYVNGAGGSWNIQQLKAHGGNSVRTWGTDNLWATLDEAHRLDMTVTVGIWLGHKEHGFSHADPKQVKDQYDRVEKDVLRYRNHPAVLFWGLGNEMELPGAEGEAVWKAVGELAKMVKRHDPNHPTMTVVAEISEEKIGQIKQFAPEIDVLGINSYGGIMDLPERLAKAGWTKPYMVTEFGPMGPWEVRKGPSGALIEPNSTEKANRYALGYEKAVASQKGKALGAYAFLWGSKPEGTPTWFGMVLPTGQMLGAVDRMSQAWTGKKPANQAPVISQATCAQEGKVLQAGEKVSASVKVQDPDGDRLTYRWYVLADDPIASFGDAVPCGAGSADGPDVEFVVPRDPRNYRLYAIIDDGKGKAAMANWPFSVRD